MLNRIHRLLLEPDANDGGASSTLPEGTSTEVQSTDTAVSEAQETPAGSEKPKGESDSPPEQNRVELDKKLQAISDKYKKKPENQEKETETDTTVEEKQEEKSEKAVVKDADTLPPFHEHPRWKEVQAKLKETEQRIEELKPAAERAQKLATFQKERGVTDEQLEAAMRMADLMQNDPEMARKELQPYIESLDAYVGNKLPDDLQKRVEEGLVDEETAKELVRLRAQLDNKERQQKTVQERMLQVEQARKVEALNSWESTKMQSDPDYLVKNGDEFSKQELVVAALHDVFSRQAPKSAEDAVTVAEQVYKRVNATAAKRVVSVAQRPGPNGVSRVTKKQPPKTSYELAKEASAKYQR